MANGENIAAGRADAKDVLDQWHKSDGHCKNMGNPSFKMFAVGHGYNRNAMMRNYWVQMFKMDEVQADRSCYPASHSAVVSSASADEDADAADAVVGLPWEQN